MGMNLVILFEGENIDLGCLGKWFGGDYLYLEEKQ
jgi:hypothetical protein